MRCPEMAREGTGPVPPPKARFCQVPGCADNLQGGPKYNRRYRICNLHCNQLSLELPGLGLVRFCHLCRHFQPLEDFFGARKSCRASLAEHRLRAQRRGQAHDSAARPMDEDSADEQQAAAAQHSSSRLLQQDFQQHSTAAESGMRQSLDPESPRAGTELAVDSWGSGLAMPDGATPVGALPPWSLHGSQPQQAAQGTSGTLAPGHSATTSLGGGMLPGAADAGQLLEAAGPAQQPNGAEGVPPPQSPTDLDDFMDWLVEQPDCVNEWLSSVEMEQSNLALPPVRTTAERHDCQESELPSQEMQQLQPWQRTTGGSTCPTPPETPILVGPGAMGSMLPADQLGCFCPQPSPAGSLESMAQWWPGPCATPLAATPYASAADLAVQQGLAQPLQPAAPALPGTQARLAYPGSVTPLPEQECLSSLPQPEPLLPAQLPPQLSLQPLQPAQLLLQPPQLLLQPSSEVQQQRSNFGSVEENLLFAVQWRAEQLSQRLFNISAHLLPLGLRQTILHIAAQP